MSFKTYCRFSSMAEIAGRALIAVFIAIQLSCTQAIVPEPPTEKPTREELLNLLELSVSEFDSIKGLARISYRQNGRKQAANHVVLARSPDRLRLETLGLFGSPALLASTDGVRSIVLVPGEGQAFVGPADGDFLRRVTRLPLTTEMVVSIVLRRPDILDWQQADISYHPDATSRLTLQDGRLSQELDFDASRKLVRVAYYADSRHVSTIRYSEYVDGFPNKVLLDLPASQVVAELEFSELAINTSPEDAVFRLVPSEAYQVAPFPEY